MTNYVAPPHAVKHSSFLAHLVVSCSLGLFPITLKSPPVPFIHTLILPFPLSVSARELVLCTALCNFLLPCGYRNVLLDENWRALHVEVFVWTCSMCNYVGSFVLVSWVVSRCVVWLIIDVGDQRLGAPQGLLALESEKRLINAVCAPCASSYEKWVFVLMLLGRWVILPPFHSLLWRCR